MTVVRKLNVILNIKKVSYISYVKTLIIMYVRILSHKTAYYRIKKILQLNKILLRCVCT